MSPEASIVAGRVLGLCTDLSADLEALERVRAEIDAAVDESNAVLPVKARAAMLAVGLHAYYGAVEAALTRIAREVDGGSPSGADWHRTLLERMAREVRGLRPAILSERSVLVLRRLLGFRHFFRHAYAVDLDLSQLERHASALLQDHGSVVGDLERFLSQLQAVAEAVPAADES